MEKDLKLSVAQAGWNYGEHDGKWYVKTPEGEVLFILDGEFNEQSAMQAIHLGRIYEHKAYEIGVVQGKIIQAAVTKNKVAQLEMAVKTLGEMNEQLSERLEKYINQE